MRVVLPAALAVDAEHGETGTWDPTRLAPAGNGEAEVVSHKHQEEWRHI